MVGKFALSLVEIEQDLAVLLGNNTKEVENILDMALQDTVMQGMLFIRFSDYL